MTKSKSKQQQQFDIQPGTQNSDLQQAKLNWGLLAKRSSSGQSGWSTPDSSSTTTTSIQSTAWEDQLNQFTLNDRQDAKGIVKQLHLNLPDGAVLGYCLNGAFVPLSNVSSCCCNKKTEPK